MSTSKETSPVKKVRIINACEPGSYEAGLLRQNFDLEAFRGQIGEILRLCREYAGDDTQKQEEFVEAYRNGTILKPK